MPRDGLLSSFVRFGQDAFNLLLCHGHDWIAEVKNNRIDGYVKPLFQDVDFYDPNKDKDKAVAAKIYKAVIDGVTSLLENTPRDEVATKSDMSGRIENPQASTWQIIGKLVQNAFFNAILPGFEGKHESDIG